jgi:hypothetical protein
MNHLLSGTALAVALVLAASVSAQTGSPMTPSSPYTAPSVSTVAPMEPMGSHKTRSLRMRTGHHRAMRHGRVRATSPSDNVANQLNAQEAARTGSSAPMGGPPGMMGSRVAGAYGQPNPEQGIPGAGQSLASSHYPSGSGPAYVPGQFQSSPSGMR